MTTMKRGLGRGLNDLRAEMGSMGQSAVLAGVERVVVKPILLTQIAPNGNQPRKTFNDANLADLAASIKERGVLQPILVRPVFGEGHLYEIIAGERRWRAARMAGLTEIPALIKSMTEENSAEIALIENIQRENLSPVEEASGYKSLMDKFGYSYADVSRLMGKSESYLKNILRLLDLPGDVRELVNQGSLSASQARTILAAENPTELAKKAVAEKLNVRQLEDVLRSDPMQRKAGRQSAATTPLDMETAREIEKNLGDATGLKTKVSIKSGGSGHLTIIFDNRLQREQLVRIILQACNKI
ncbi:MAG: ParB/RepB/Spo0J family partition protein [Rickettsiales bacterium]|jgi:ParB family chromosome partitioning protein|nr:ParB/RepB/Spo0J family partition protein [Rickettsiales bacterium]